MVRILLGLTLFCSASTVWAIGALSSYEKQLIRDYTARGYFISNVLEEVVDSGVPGLEGPLFYGRPDVESPNDYRYMLQLNRALDKIPPYGQVGRTVVYRGIYTSGDSPPEVRFAKGRVWRERRYSSSTTSLMMAKKFAAGAYKNEGCGGCSSTVKNPDPTLSVVLSVVSRGARDISRYAAKKSEKEVLFKSGTIFKVTAARRDLRGRYLATLVELDPQALSTADQVALEISERERFDGLIARFYTEPGSLEEAVVDWNEAYRRWRSTDDFNKPVNFDEEGG